MRIIITSASPYDPNFPDACKWELYDGPDLAFSESGSSLSLYSAYAEILQARAALGAHLTGDSDPNELMPDTQFSSN